MGKERGEEREVRGKREREREESGGGEKGRKRRGDSGRGLCSGLGKGRAAAAGLYLMDYNHLRKPTARASPNVTPRTISRLVEDETIRGTELLTTVKEIIELL